MEKQSAHILIVDDDDDILVAGRMLIKRHFTQVTICNNPQQIPVLLEQTPFDAILLDMNFSPGESSGEQGFNWLNRILEIEPQSVVIMLTAHGGVDVAVDAMKLGATDFIAKPWQNEKVIATLSSAVKLGQSQREASQLRSANQLLAGANSNNPELGMLGHSSAMQNVRSLIERCAPTDANVLILGENGTGKELVARAIHQQSLRADQIFMPVDLGAVSESLFESELFGHKKGAFTGATEDRTGRLQAANGGTLFLDEISNLPLHLQAKLLTVLEQRQVTPLGANKSIGIDVRVVAATNLNKLKLTDESCFRQDLLFRLNTVEILLPPLRDRTEDIVAIAQHYAQKYAKKYAKSSHVISEQGLTAIQNYAWPGNVRALRHAVERAVILSDSEKIQAEDFQLDSSLVTRPMQQDQASNHDGSLSQDETAFDNVSELNLERLEKQAILSALKAHRYNISHSAKALGLTRAALYRRMEKHGI
jgi:DNA-binding NtrC family response regulator